jgi:hypothetical protein
MTKDRRMLAKISKWIESFPEPNLVEDWEITAEDLRYYYEEK